MRLVALDRDGPDLAAVRAICATGRAGELLDRALAGTPECQARVALAADGSVAGFALSGLVAGALGTAALLWVAVAAGRRRRGIGGQLVADALGRLAAGGARLAVAELAEDPGAAAAVALLAAAGFEREAVVPDFYRDGVPLSLWRRPLR